jgi:hypothetical protein
MAIPFGCEALTIRPGGGELYSTMAAGEPGETAKLMIYRANRLLKCGNCRAMKHLMRAEGPSGHSKHDKGSLSFWMLLLEHDLDEISSGCDRPQCAVNSSFCDASGVPAGWTLKHF